MKWKHLHASATETALVPADLPKPSHQDDLLEKQVTYQEALK